MKSYDIFISYRREDGNAFARQMQLKLENYGYRVFLDVEELKDGVFDQRIIDAITGAKVFIALLTPNYLCRCASDEDWVRKEIECALQNEIHIVPINIDRLFKDFPEDCPLHVRGGIGQHQFSEVFTGQQFSTTMRDLDDNRLRPYIREGRAEGDGPVGGGSVVRIRPDMECRMLRFGEPVATLKAAAYNKVTLRKGRHVFDFVSTECKDDHLEMTYDVNKDEDYFDVQLMPVKAARLQREESVRKREERDERARKLKGDFKVGLTATWRWLRWLLLIFAVAFIVVIASVIIDQRREERLAAEAAQELAERIAQEEAERIAQEEAERIAQEEAERIAQEKAEQKAKQEAERKAKEEAERKATEKMVAEGKGRNGVYQIGDYYNRGGKEGMVFEVSDGGRHGKIVSLDEAELQWCTDEQHYRQIFVGASSTTDGKANTDRVMARSDSDEYPAFVWCRDKGRDWYLPAIDELKSIYATKEKINDAFERLGKMKFRDEYYWSSSETNKFCAWIVGMYSGSTYNDNKGNPDYVRAVSAF